MYDDEDDMSSMDQQEYQHFVEELEFEQNFYKLLAGTDKFEVISIPDPDGTVLSNEHIQLIADQWRKHGMAVLYKVSNGKFITVYNPDSKKYAIIPEGDKAGFEC